jgi:FdhE protein
MTVVVGGAIRTGVELGDTTNPDFCRLPDPATVFERRSGRFAALSVDHPAAPYLRFLSGVAAAQHAAVAATMGLAAPEPVHLARCREHGMPPLRQLALQEGVPWRPTLDALLGSLVAAEMPESVRVTLQGLRDSSDETLAELALAALEGEPEAERLPETLFVFAALQVEMVKLAALLDPLMLVPVGEGACPACGSPPVASLVVGWPKAQGSRYLCCSLCATAWNYVRIKCSGCGSTKGIAYLGIEGRDEVAKGETCESCKGYLKLFQQQKDPLVDPVADDVATLGLDLLLREAGWLRLGHNMFLLGS